MTQPVQEPTFPRDIAGGQWATSQLARRPPVVTAGTDLPAAAMVWDAGGTIPVDTPYNLQTSVGNDLHDIAAWDDGYATNPELFYPDLANGRINLYPDGSSNPRTAGVYLSVLTIDWAENWDNGDLYARIIYGPGMSADFENWQAKNVYGKTQGIGHLLGFDESVIVTDVVTVQANSSGASTNSWIGGSFMHRAGGGSDRDLGQVTLNVVRLRPWVIADATLYP